MWGGSLGLPEPRGRRHNRDLRGARAPTHVAGASIDLRLPACHSLKEKRAVVKPILASLQRRFHVAAAEIGYHDLWQRAEIGVATVAESAGQVGLVLDEVERFVWSEPGVEVVEVMRTWCEDQ
ncbi:MAG: DUF503 domain-containing protein [Acidimicrobiales bacterium]